MDSAIPTTAYDLKNKLEQSFAERKALLSANDPAGIRSLREEAFARFSEKGFPTPRDEQWRGTDLSKALLHDYAFAFDPSGENIDIESIFKCNVPHFETFLVAQLNGWYVYSDAPIRTLPGGLVVGSLAAAFRQFPGLVEKHYGKIAGSENESLTSLNTAFAQDGIFLYVPDNVSVEDTIQMVSVVDSEQNLLLNTRNLVILGNNSHLRLVHCDDSISHNYTFINSVTEIAIGSDSSLDYYKLQNKDDHSTLVTSLNFRLDERSRLSSNTISLNGGTIRNKTSVTLDGEYAAADISGLYLMDRNQHIDNLVFVDHVKPHCESVELFKGVLDDHASGVFNGHILVRRDAQQTQAYQKNRNILLTDKATIDSRPFLEIYADDVKCSHGATVGQLDPEAMFYIRSRGISEANARILLMYAFAAEVINKIAIPELRTRMDDMVKKRLRGELSYCDQCVLHCSTQEKTVHFDIDISKIY